MKTTVLLVRKIPPRLRAKFKSACAARGRTMQEVIESLLRLYVDRPAVLEEPDENAKSEIQLT